MPHELLEQNPAWRAVLEAYWQLFRAQSEQDEVANSDEDESDRRWFDRISGVETVDSDELSVAHGRLIAHGFLAFDLGDRDGRMKYQLTPQARSVLNGERMAAPGVSRFERFRVVAEPVLC